MSPTLSEDELLSCVLEAAKLLGWRRYHIRNSRRGVVQGDVGFPDVVLACRGHVLFVELKAEQGKVTPDQEAWLSDLCGVVWRPSQWFDGTIERALGHDPAS